jgi:hypothetical protein
MAVDGIVGQQGDDIRQIGAASAAKNDLATHRAPSHGGLFGAQAPAEPARQARCD